MLLWIFIAIFVVGILWLIFDWNYDGDTWGAGLTVFGAIALTFALLFLCILHFSANGDVAQLQARYESLVYQYENDVYDNDNDIGKRELIADITEWNEKIASGKVNQNNFWIGIFVPDIYDQFELIELDRGEE